jgi:uncharacterized protein YkwD
MSRSTSLVILFLLLLCPTAVISARVITQTDPTEAKPLIPVSGGGAFTGCGVSILTAVNRDYEQKIIEATNEIRMKAGLSPLKKVDELVHSARYHAADMDHDDYFNHNTYNRKNTVVSEVCDTWQRIGSFYPDWQALAENIAAGQKTPEQAMDGWMNSPEHRENILNQSYWEIGAGFFEGTGKFRYYWVQNFAKPMNRFPLVIAGEKAKTGTRNVSIYIYGEWDTFRLKNDSGDWSEWRSFQTTSTWLLPANPGLHKVTAELRRQSRSTTTSDTIELFTRLVK